MSMGENWDLIENVKAAAMWSHLKGNSFEYTEPISLQKVQKKYYIL